MVHPSTCHRTGESAVATGAEGADGVCVLIMYCSGAAYLENRLKEFIHDRNHTKFGFDKYSVLQTEP